MDFYFIMAISEFSFFLKKEKMGSERQNKEEEMAEQTGMKKEKICR